MSDGVGITPGVGVTVATDEVTGLTTQLPGAAQVQFQKIVDGRENGTSKWVIESDGAARYVGDAVSAGTVTPVASSATVVNLAANNAARRGLFIFNFSTADLYIKFGAGADFTTPSFTIWLGMYGLYEMAARPIYTGLVTGIWSSANGYALVTEV